MTQDISSQKAFESEVKRADFVARHLWKGLRLFFRHKLSRRCTRCVLSEAAVMIGPEGLCAKCQDPGHRSEDSKGSPHSKPRQQLNEILKSHEGRGSGPYDALLLFSGGKDSIYMLKTLQQNFPGLRILTMLVDNGYLSPIALENIQHVLSKLPVDHLHHKLEPAVTQAVFRYGLTHLQNQRIYSLVDYLDGSMTFSAARIVAAEKKIPLILCGLGKIQIENVFDDVEFELSESNENKGLEKIGGIRFEEVYHKDNKQGPWWNPDRWKPEERARFILPMVVWDPDESEILKKLEGWKLLDRSRFSPLLTNNRLIPIIAMAEIAHFGYTVFELEFSKMVRLGKAERNYWINLFEMMELSAKTGLFINDSVRETLGTLNLTPVDIGIGQTPKAT